MPDDGFDALAGGLAKTYGRARDRMGDAYTKRTVEAFHEWRKRVKCHRYHDLAELGVQLHGDPDDFGGAGLVGELTALLDRRRAQLQLDARPLGERLFVESAADFVERVRGYWDIWTGERAGEELLPPRAVSDYAPSPPT